jgi:putative NADH-flavin reductase
VSTVTVFGATGYAGRAITAELLERNHAVVAVARSVASLTERPNLTVVAGSLHNPTVLEQAAKGAEVILVALPARAINGARLIDSLTALLATAADEGARLGIMGGAGSLQVTPGGPHLVDTPDFPESALAEALSHRAVLDTLRGSGNDVDWFYVSPGANFGSWNPGERTGSYRTGSDVLLTDSEGNSNLSGADLAIAFADEIDHPAHHRTRFTVAY